MGACCGQNKKIKKSNGGLVENRSPVNLTNQNVPHQKINETSMNSQLIENNQLVNANISFQNADHEPNKKPQIHSKNNSNKENINEELPLPKPVEEKPYSKEKENQLLFSKFQSNHSNDNILDTTNCYFFGMENDKPQIIKFEPINGRFTYIEPPHEMEIFNFCTATYSTQETILIAGGLKDEINVSDKFYQYDVTKNTSIKLASIHYKRFAHQATLHNNNLYLVGGIGEGHQHLKSCECFNLQDRTWKMLPELNIGHAFGLLIVYGSELYVMGGTTGISKTNAFDSSELSISQDNRFIDPSKCNHSRKIEKFDNIKNKWIILDIKLPIGIDNTFACSFANDELCLIGGQTKFLWLNSNIVLNLKRGTYTLKKFMKNQRVAHKGIIHQNEIWIFGGDDDETIEKYDMLREEWNHRTDTYKSVTSNIQGYGYSSLPLIIKASNDKNDLEDINNQMNDANLNDRECFLFGDDYTSFILGINFTRKSIKEYPIPFNLRLLGYQGVCKLKDGRYFFNGGMNITNSDISNNTFIYIPYENKAIKTTKSLKNRYTFNLIHKDNYVYAIGGRAWGDDEAAIMKDCERYNISSSTWEKIADLNEKRCSAMCFIHKDTLYVAGGYGGSQERCISIEKYNEMMNKWEKINIELTVMLEYENKSNLIPSGLEGSCAIISNISDDVYFIGGRSDINDTDQVWKFDLQKGKTLVIGTLEDRKSLHKVSMYDEDKICIFGGESNLIEFFDIQTGKVIVNDFGTQIEKAITKQLFISGKGGQAKLLRQSLA